VELIYSRWLAWGARAGLAVLTAAFLAYAGGWAAPLIPLQELPGLWSLPLERYLAQSGAPTGWHWFAVATKGDYANLMGIALLGFVSMACYLRLLPVLWQRGERALALIAAAQVAVLAAAAIGFFTAGA
jgi:hypothetical protein